MVKIEIPTDGPCRLCGKKADLQCDGSGHLPVIAADQRGIETLYLNPCPGMMVKRFKELLTPDIWKAKTLAKSPLDGRTKDNVLIKADRYGVHPHLKCSLWKGGPGLNFRIVTDNLLLDAWLSKERDGQGESKLSLRDVVEPPGLLIIQLGVVSWKNVALPGVIMESILTRQHLGRPTWVIVPTDSPLEQGFNQAYSPELVDRLNREFKSIEIQRKKGEVSKPFAVVSSTDEEGPEPPQSSGLSRYLNR